MTQEIILAENVSIMTADEIPVKTLTDEWIDYNKEKGRTKETVKTYEKVVTLFSNWTSANNVADYLNAKTVNAFINETKTRKNVNTGKAISARTLRLYVAALRVFVKFAAKKGYCEDFTDDLQRISLKGVETHTRNSLTENQAKDLLGTVRKDASTYEFVKDEEKIFVKTAARKSEEMTRNAAIIALMMFCGLRCIEVTRLEMCHYHKTYIEVTGKGHIAADADVKVPSNVRKLIDEYLKVRKAADGVTSLFTSCSKRNKGKALSTQTINNICKHYLTAAGVIDDKIKEVPVEVDGVKKTERRRADNAYYKTSAHSLRHFTACQMLRKGISLEWIRQTLRHTNLSVTSIYLNDLDREKNDATEQISLDFFA